jgi:Predicted membrane protein (DUF2207) N-terminal domain
MRQLAPRAVMGWLLLCALFALAGAYPATAHPRSGVSFQRREYDVRIARNGDVTVRERWDTTFNGGPFDSATLGVYLAHTTGVDFGAVDGATPGSEKASDVEDKAGSRIRQLTWSFPAAHDESRTFTIPYTIHGAMAQNSSKVWLDWHFLDGVGRSAILANAVTITITPPSGLSANNVQAQAVYPGATLKPTIAADGAVTVATQSLNSGASLEALVVLPRSALDASVKRPYWQRSDAPPTLPTRLGDESSQGNTNSQGDFWSGLLSNFALVISVGAVIATLLIGIAWWLTRRLRRNVAELSQSLATKEEPEVYATGELPAINLNFDDISLPPLAEQPQIEGLDFSSSSISDIVFDDEIAAQGSPSHPTSAGPE